jgi:DNA-binding beta-propeller fold protein YncE
MKRTLNLIVGVTVVAFMGACSTGEGANGEAPMFAVDPLWPQPLPNHWLIGATIGVTVDSRDHIWIVHRNTPDQFVANTEIGLVQDPPVSECCAPGPPVMEFDQDGNLISSFGGPSSMGEYEWPLSNHGIEIDNMDNLWIGGNGGSDSHILKFSRDGTFLQQFGRAGARLVRTEGERQIFESGSNDPVSFGRVAKISLDAEANELFVADGYLNKRVVVLDAADGSFKRYWGAYGNRPDDEEGRMMGRYSPGETPAPQFRGPVHCAEPTNDGLVYVCDRAADRIQVFQKDGTFVNEVVISPATLSQGSTWDIAFSPDDAQTYLYLADGQNMKVYIILRESMEILTSFGDGGRQPGLFFAVHSIATDSDGNIYTTETYEGSRIQKFVYLGIGPIPSANQGALWEGETHTYGGM